MKIAMVHNDYQQPGGEDVVFAQERRILEDEGHRIIVYRRGNSEIAHAGFIDRCALAKNTIWSTNARRDFAALLDREKPDIVHVHNTFVVISPSIYSACSERQIPVVQTLHNYRLLCPAATFSRNGEICEDCSNGRLWNAVRHKCYRDSRMASSAVALMLATHRLLGTWERSITSYIALTDFARNKFIAAGLNPRKLFVKPNFVDPDPGIQTNPGDYALFTGRLALAKGLTILLRAWERLPAPWPLQIAGDGPERLELDALIANRCIRGVTFKGRLSREDSIAAIKGARFIIVPSAWYEAFPMVIVEAMACGVPVICSRLGAMEEIVSDRSTGLHFTPADAEDLARKIGWAWNHPGEMAEMGRRARREYEDRYTAEKNYSLLLDIYERTLTRSIYPAFPIAS